MAESASRFPAPSTSVDPAQAAGQDRNYVAREMQNLSGNANIVFNVTYNVHYQSDRQSDEHRRDVEAYGLEYSRLINRRSLQICEQPMSNRCIDRRNEYVTSCIEDQLLTVEENYYHGKTGIKEDVEYVADTKYRKTCKRPRSTLVTPLHELHKIVNRRRNDPIAHVMIVGSQGCGKSVLCKRYGRMVLDREIPELADVEVVHYLNMREVRDDKKYKICDLIFDNFLSAEPSQGRLGYDWVREHPEKILFIFDECDKFVRRFSEDNYPVNYFHEASPHEFLQSILQTDIFRGCRTLFATREWPIQSLFGGCRPDKLVLVGPLSVDQRLSLTRSLFPGDLGGERHCKELQRWYPMSFSMTTDVIHLYFALSSLKREIEDGYPRTETDGMLTMLIMEHIPRTRGSSRYFYESLPKLRHLGFYMVKNNKMALRWKELEALNIKHDDMHDIIVVAPENNCILTSRLWPSDYCFFFTHQPIMEALAATYISDMAPEVFKKFAETELHTARWIAVRRLLCGVVLNYYIRRYCGLFVDNCKKPSENEKQLQTSMEKEVKKLDTLPDDMKFEVLSSVHECGERTGVGMLSSLKEINLHNYVLEPPDLYVINKLGKTFFTQLRSVNLVLHKDINFEEFETLVEQVLKKVEKIHVDISQLEVTPDHAKAVDKLRRRESGRHSKRQAVVVISKKAPSTVANTFKSLEKATTGSITFNIEQR